MILASSKISTDLLLSIKDLGVNEHSIGCGVKLNKNYTWQLFLSKLYIKASFSAKNFGTMAPQIIMQ